MRRTRHELPPVAAPSSRKPGKQLAIVEFNFRHTRDSESPTAPDGNGASCRERLETNRSARVSLGRTRNRRGISCASKCSSSDVRYSSCRFLRVGDRRLHRLPVSARPGGSWRERMAEFLAGIGVASASRITARQRSDEKSSGLSARPRSMRRERALEIARRLPHRRQFRPQVRARMNRPATACSSNDARSANCPAAAARSACSSSAWSRASHRHHDKRRELQRQCGTSGDSGRRLSRGSIAKTPISRLTSAAVRRGESAGRDVPSRCHIGPEHASPVSAR